MDTDLTLDDIEFLRTVRQINVNPDEFEGTEGGEVPATTSAIRLGSTLSRGEVKYRIDNGNRILNEGLIEIHAAEFDSETRTFGPKSIELTERGRERLEQLEGDSLPDESNAQLANLSTRVAELEDVVGGSDQEAIVAELEAVRESITELEAQVDAISESVATMEQSQWGGLSDERIEDVSTLIKKTPAMQYAFGAVFGVDINEIVEGGSYTDREAASVQEHAFEVLSEAATESEQQEAARDEDEDEDGSGVDDGGSDGSVEVSAGQQQTQTAADGQQNGESESTGQSSSSESTDVMDVSPPTGVEEARDSDRQ